jgi:hypothetical protein
MHLMCGNACTKAAKKSFRCARNLALNWQDERVTSGRGLLHWTVLELTIQSSCVLLLTKDSYLTSMKWTSAIFLNAKPNGESVAPDSSTAFKEQQCERTTGTVSVTQLVSSPSTGPVQPQRPHSHDLSATHFPVPEIENWFRTSICISGGEYKTKNYLEQLNLPSYHPTPNIICGMLRERKVDTLLVK